DRRQQRRPVDHELLSRFIRRGELRQWRELLQMDFAQPCFGDEQPAISGLQLQPIAAVCARLELPVTETKNNCAGHGRATRPTGRAAVLLCDFRVKHESFMNIISGSARMPAEEQFPSLRGRLSWAQERP